jgi:23S rRNA 5-hydroxycytidine C2501 synthase
MNKQRPIELLSPAKNSEFGIAAINHGADAVYIGFERFGARAAAGNSLSEIEKLIRYAHLYHSKVFITLNTILYENELEETQELINTFYEMGADALIIQDMGIIEMDLPPIPLHASTQTHNNNLSKVKFLQDVGFDRIILARELSINEISEIRKNTTVELEAFIHGALCVCYSGQCYLSYAITGRSANRGECAQPCRSRYDLVDNSGNTIIKDKHLLSLKDQNQTENIQQLIDAGISSLKIEGRLKDINYVKNITAHYRGIIDSKIYGDKTIRKASSGSVQLAFTPDPDKTFNRAYTKYFAEGRVDKIASFNTQKSIGKFLGEVTTVGDNWFALFTDDIINNNDGLCFINRKEILEGFKVNRVDNNKIYPNQSTEIFSGAKIYRNYDHAFHLLLNNPNSSVRQIDCNISIEFLSNQIHLVLTDEDGIKSELSINNNFDSANDSKRALESISNQLKKSSNTPYSIKNISIIGSINSIPFVPISVANSWRREIIEIHTTTRISKHPFKRVLVKPNNAEYPQVQLNYKANVSNSLSKKFYERHGVKSIDKAFELTENAKSLNVMETKYCILFEMGQCDGKKTRKDISQKLYLSDGKNNYPLLFNCSDCNMMVQGKNY